MTAPRLATSVTVSALLRLAERDGGFGTVVRKGDPGAGAILVVLAERGVRVRILERLLQPNETYRWTDSLGAGHNEEEIEKFLVRRRNFDPDSWILELDTASAERLAAQMAAFD